MFGMPEKRVQGIEIITDTNIKISAKVVEARLQAGEVSGVTLLAYADSLAVLNACGTEKYGPIPMVFWDVDTPAKSAIYLWQNLVAGTTRHNPLTHRAAYSHGFASRFNVATIWQYDVGVAMSVGEVWGVSGFDPAYVGPASNTNQIEHMSVSITAQAVLGEHLSTLAAFEGFETLVSHGTAAESIADEALNKAVADHFIPLFENDLRAAVASLRLALKP